MMNYIVTINFGIFSLIRKILKDDIQNMLSSLHRLNEQNMRSQLKYLTLNLYIHMFLVIDLSRMLLLDSSRGTDLSPYKEIFELKIQSFDS